VISRREDGAEWSGVRAERRVVRSERAKLWVADIVGEGWVKGKRRGELQLVRGGEFLFKRA